jgi:GTPase SAR1 family protein
MAEAQSNTPTFKLVLVGDGGTGKVIIPANHSFAS